MVWLLVKLQPRQLSLLRSSPLWLCPCFCKGTAAMNLLRLKCCQPWGIVAFGPVSHSEKAVFAMRR